MSAKEHSQRAVILVIVALFFLTSLGSTIYVVYDAYKNKKNNNDTTSTSSANTNQQAKPQEDKPKKEGALEGTKLANFTPVEKVDQLQVTDLVPGTGAEVTAQSTVTADYTGALAKTGVIFQSSKDTGQPFTSPLSGLIQGWQQGMVGMKVGGTRRLTIPSAQAYGDKATGNIPANSDLVFDIELHDVK